MACDRNTINCKIRRGKDRPPCCIEGFKNLLFYVTDLFDKHNITYWLDYGTLLGAVRKGEIIPWDTDVDLGILETDVEKILGLFLNDRESEYDYAAHMIDGKQLVPVHHIYVFYSETNKLSLEMSIWNNADGILNRRRDGEGERAIGKGFNISCIQPLEEVIMYNRKFKCPNNTNEFLVYRYGPNWETETRG